MILLSRDDFRAQVFARDRDRCVCCAQPGQDAHHILERRLFPDGGYYLANGATLCGPCHLKAESTELSCDEIRVAGGISDVVLPPHLYDDERYDKWGNVILPTGRRLKGELFDDPSVQKILAPVLHLFDNRVKYPRTWHLPWSPGVTKDDRVLPGHIVESWVDTDVVITEKMDGENTTMYRDYVHARSTEYSPHPSRSYVRQLHASICGEIPDSMRICGENLWAKRSIKYPRLSAFFQVFSIWEGTHCLSWADTVEWVQLVGLTLVPVLYRGPFAPTPLNLDWNEHEGYVVRPASRFTLREFSTRVGKFVRASHITTHGNWMRSKLEQNTLA